MASTGKTGDWSKVRAAFDSVDGDKLKGVLDKAILQEAQFLRGKMIKRFSAGGPGWAPHSAMTLAIRAFTGGRGSKLLIQSGDLRNSIGVISSPGEVFVGVRRTASSSSPMGIANLASIHEEGRDFTVRMTDPMRRFLFAAMHNAGIEGDSTKKGTGDGMIHIRIPARPFIGPVLDEFATPDKLEASIVARISKMLGGTFGGGGGTPRT